MLYDTVMRYVLAVVELNLMPDFVLRRGIRFLLALRLKELKAPTGEEQTRRLLVRAVRPAAQRCVVPRGRCRRCFPARSMWPRSACTPPTHCPPHTAIALVLTCPGAGLCGGPEAPPGG